MNDGNTKQNVAVYYLLYLELIEMFRCLFLKTVVYNIIMPQLIN